MTAPADDDSPRASPPLPSGFDPRTDASARTVVWSAMGGWRGIAESVLPSLLFVVIFTVGSAASAAGPATLWLSLGASVGLAAVFTAVRLIGRTQPAAAVGGLVAAVAAAALALLTGRGEDNFVIGFVSNALYGSAFTVSALVGYPLVGVVVGVATGEGLRWRRDARKRRTFTWLSLAWAALFAGRLAVQLPLYLSGEVTWLGTAKLAMGLPLFAPLVALSWLAVRPLYSRPDAEATAGTEPQR